MYDINACRIDCHLVNLALSVAKILSIFSNGQTLPEKLYMCYNYGLVIFLENTLIHCLMFTTCFGLQLFKLIIA